MPRKKIDFDTVRKIGLALPDVEEGIVYGTTALKTRGKMFACIPIHRSAEPNSLAIQIDMNRRAELIAADSATYYVPNHYVNYPCVLVRLSRVHRDELRDLLLMAWRFVTTRAKPRVRRKTRR